MVTPNKGKEMARKIAFNSAAVMDEMTIALNGPVHFDDYVSVINSRIDEAAMDFDMENYNSLLSEMQKFNLKPAIILDAPIEMELPNHGWAHIPAIEIGEFENEEMEESDAIDEFFTEFDKAHPISEDEMQDILNEVSENVEKAIREDNAIIHGDEFDCIPD